MLRPVQAAAAANNNNNNKESMRKTRLCERFMQTGNCPYGDKCTFAHGCAYSLRGRC